MDFDRVVETIARCIDFAGVTVIAAGAVIAALRVLVDLQRRSPGVYQLFRSRLGRAILLGLELLVAGDIIKTVAVTPTLTDVAVLAIIVLIRTFLSWSLDLEITGRWPWQRSRGEASAPS
ncbi:DUF1622 domain-containing protein [Rhodococcus triatomae]|nr:DUF1622 domain-containing protein [Rhodococcus triatomae]QNG21562.1 DUF1622 domain-containing protein [Rhodococcus triatomae]QNG25699.1 DUF1622 domain-containing protein [Rhodococcus triatomae]